MYVKIKDGKIQKYPYTKSDFYKDNHNVSFPRNIGDEFLEKYGVYRVVISEKPIIDKDKQFLEKCKEPILFNGYWTIFWNVLEKTDEELNTLEYEKIVFIKNERNRLLSETDWMALSDNVLSDGWKEYRQKLRDITKQDTYPDSVIWPKPPMK